MPVLPKTPNALVVMWREPNQQRSIPVARLAVVHQRGTNGPLYEFSYLRGHAEAVRHGFTFIVPFEETTAIYRSEQLFPFFKNRLMPENRPEYAGHLDHLLLDHQAHPMDVLSRTGGVRVTDRYELFPIPRWDEELPGFRTLFLMHGLRLFPPLAHERIAALEPEEPLFLLWDVQNAWEPGALALRTEDRVLVGYVPSYLLPEMCELARSCGIIEVRVARMNPPPAPQDQRLLCLMESCWPESYRPFEDDRLQPLSPDATPTADLVGDIRRTGTTKPRPS